MAGISLLAHMESQLEAARRQIQDAAIDFSIPDVNVLELRADARRVSKK